MPKIITKNNYKNYISRTNYIEELNNQLTNEPNIKEEQYKPQIENPQIKFKPYIEEAPDEKGKFNITFKKKKNLGNIKFIIK